MCDQNDSLLPEYYLLIDEKYGFLYRIPVHDFETMFELIDDEVSEHTNTYQFNKEAKSRNTGYYGFCLDTYICECEFGHARSDWITGNVSFKVKGIYYWHNNIYSN